MNEMVEVGRRAAPRTRTRDRSAQHVAGSVARNGEAALDVCIRRLEQVKDSGDR